MATAELLRNGLQETRWHIPSPNDCEALPHNPQQCGRAACPTHNADCAFHGDEAGRCPFCHCAWWVIVSSGWHSCEKSHLTPPTVRRRIPEIVAMRKAKESADNSLVEPFCSHLACET